MSPNSKVTITEDHINKVITFMDENTIISEMLTYKLFFKEPYSLHWYDFVTPNIKYKSEMYVYITEYLKNNPYYEGDYYDLPINQLAILVANDAVHMKLIER